MKNFRYVLAGICFIIFLGIMYSVLKYDSLSIDTSVYNFISNNIMTNGLHPYVKVITELGGVGFTVLLTLLIIIFSKKYRWFIAGNVVVTTLVNQIVKHIVRRPRPSVLRLVDESGYSFPSGHSMVSVALYGIIVYTIYKNVKNKYVKWISIVLLSLLVLLIGFSRIYVGVHYFTDVVGGFTLGLVVLIIYIDIYDKVKVKYEK